MGDLNIDNDSESATAMVSECLLKGKSLSVLIEKGHLDLKTLGLDELIPFIAYHSYEKGKEDAYKIMKEHDQSQNTQTYGW